MKCDELKVQKIGDLCFDFKMGKNIEPYYYRKSEVDAAIDELKKEIKRTQKIANEQTFKLCVEKENVWQLEELLRKQKIKRAEAMAKYHKVCADIFRMKRNSRRYDEVELAESDYRKCRKYRKYSNLLFELADKLKEKENEVR